MSAIQYLDWDSQQLNCTSGQVTDQRLVPNRQALQQFDFVHVRIAQNALDTIGRFQDIGFRYITNDFRLEKDPLNASVTAYEDICVTVLNKQQPTFRIDGFQMDGSRLVIDPVIRMRLRSDFWDRMIWNHCLKYCDFAHCALSRKNELVGVISGFERHDCLEMFLVAVHPQYQNRKIGSALVFSVENDAIKKNKKIQTSVVVHNIGALNFYGRHGYRFRAGETILHYTNLDNGPD